MNKIRQLVLLAVGLTMSAATAGAVEALNVHLAGGGVQSTPLDNIQRITFSSDDVVLRTTGGLKAQINSAQRKRSGALGYWSKTN